MSCEQILIGTFSAVIAAQFDTTRGQVFCCYARWGVRGAADARAGLRCDDFKMADRSVPSPRQGSTSDRLVYFFVAVRRHECGFIFVWRGLWCEATENIVLCSGASNSAWLAAVAFA